MEYYSRQSKLYYFPKVSMHPVFDVPVEPRQVVGVCCRVDWLKWGAIVYYKNFRKTYDF